MMISNLIRFTMNCTNFSKNILQNLPDRKVAKRESPSFRPQKVVNYDHASSQPSGPIISVTIEQLYTIEYVFLVRKVRLM